MTPFASGSELMIAVAAQRLLAERDISTRVVSVPSLDLLLAQPEQVRKAIIGTAPVMIAVEAAVRFGCDAVIGPDGGFIGLCGRGRGAPAQHLYRHFGITAQPAAAAAMARAAGCSPCG